MNDSEELEEDKERRWRRRVANASGGTGEG